MSKTRTLIVGHGEIGQQLETELEPISPDVADIKYKGYIKGTPQYSEYDAIFICVPAEINGENPCDTSNVETAIQMNLERRAGDGVFVICTTVLPGTTDKLRAKHPFMPIVCSPVWYGCTIHSRTKDVQALAMLTSNPLLDTVWQINGRAQCSPADYFDEDADLPM